MANIVFTPAKSGLLTGQLDLDTAVLKAVPVRGYTPVATHQFVSDVTGAGGVLGATAVALAGVTVVSGVLDANDVVFTAPAANATAHGILLFQSSAVTGGADVASTAQRVIAWLDTGTGLPTTLAGTDLTVAWDNGANKILALT